MKRVHLMIVTAALAVVTPASAADEDTLRSVYGSACSSNGIDEKQCFCILDVVVDKHGETAARFVGLDMSLRYDEAFAILEEIGEDAGFAASSTFEDAQHKECSTGRLARLEGTYRSTGPAVATTMTAAANAAGGTESPGQGFATFEAFASALPILDLRNVDREVIADVTAHISSEILNANPYANFQDYITFYQIVNAKGGIDTNGDGQADLHPGDADYAIEVQKRSLPTKLYISRDGGNTQVLGEVRFRSGLFAPYVRVELPGNASGLSGFDAADLGNVEDLMRAMQTPQYLYFVFPEANPNGANYLARRDNNSIGFDRSPNGAAEGNGHDDAVFKFRIGM